MTAKEMYIRVTNDLQSLAAQRTRQYYKEQIELELNTTIESFVNSAIIENRNGFFSVDVKYLDAIQPIISQVDLSVYTDGQGNFTSHLPTNFNRVLELGAELTNCKAIRKTDYTSTTYSILELQFIETPSATAPYYQGVSFSVNGSTVYTRAEGGYTLKDANQLIDELVPEVEGLGWESIPGLIRSGCFLIRVPKPAGDATATLTYDGVEYNFTLVSNESLKIMNESEDSILTSARRLKNQMKTAALVTPYYSPSVKEVPVEIIGNEAKIYTPQNSIVNRLLMTYIRKPRKISISLNIGSDLAPSVHNTICDMTVQRIRERIGDPKYQTGLIQESKQ